MKVSSRWLRDMVPGLELGPSEIAEHLALRGAPVESVTPLGEGLEDIVVGRVLSAARHPNADRLSVTTVDAGAGTVHVVCGAPNVKAGAWYPFAPVGATLPGGLKIERRKIRGEVSEGMLCSANELGLGTDHTGILELTGDFTPGQAFAPVLGLDDVTLEVEVTSNRGDLLSHVGLARELAGAAQGGVRLPPLPGDPGPEATYLEGTSEAEAAGVTIRVEDPDLCPRYLGAVIRGVRIGPSPPWLQNRLRGAGARSINNVVDATNHVMLELGQPLHAFDLARLGGSTIVVRRARADESVFTTLDGEKRALRAGMLMICDAQRPVAIAGVMGGRESEVDERTTDILLECALFDPKSIRATRRALTMSTDASYRFERGVDPEGLRLALARAVALILATAGGQLDGPLLDVCPRPYEPLDVPLRLARVEHVLGVPFDAARVRELLEPLGFTVNVKETRSLEARVPGFRSYDVTREIDLIEEIARTHGYDAFPSDLRAFRPGTVPDHPLFGLEDELRGSLVARGLLEAQTPAFVREGEGDVRVANPLNTLEPFVRRELLPSLLRRVAHNFAQGSRDVRLFEIGTSFRKARSGEPPVEETHLVVVLAGRREPPHWSAPEEACTIWDLKGVLEEVAERAHGAGARVVPAPEGGGPFDAPEAFLVVDAAGASVGLGGRVREGLVDAPPWAGAVWGIELTLPAEPAPRPPVTYQALARFPSVERDLALLVADGTSASDVAAAIRSRGGAILEDVRVFDSFRGKAIDPGHRSLAFRLRFRAPDRTLKDEEVDRSVRDLVGHLKERMGVEVRG